MVKAVMHRRADEIIDLARTNLCGDRPAFALGHFGLLTLRLEEVASTRKGIVMPSLAMEAPKRDAPAPNCASVTPLLEFCSSRFGGRVKVKISPGNPPTAGASSPLRAPMRER
jgi:hypothetical protein